MLYTNTIYPETLDLLNKIMLFPELKNFALAGGTSLALQIGHRISYDLDFFGNQKIIKDEIFDLLANYGSINLISQSTNILIFEINKIKIDFINYRYPLINPLIIENNLRLYSIEDICAMKLAAIAGRGKKRDFIDIYFLLKSFTLNQMLGFYKAKFNDGSEFLVLKSMVYFEDAENDAELKMNTPIDWTEIKNKICTEVKNLINN